MKAAGYKTAPATFGSKTVGNVFTPEGESIELLEDQSENVQITFDDGKVVNGRAAGPKMAAPILLHLSISTCRKVTSRRSRPGILRTLARCPAGAGTTEAANLPGLNINIFGVSKKLAPTKGRMLDHFGFEEEPECVLREITGKWSESRPDA